MSLIKVQQAADYLSLSKITLNRWRCTGTGPRYIKLGGAVRYDLADLDAYARESITTSTSQSSEAKS
jgi:predicted DNA-binding transcriptional regulator AlpA